MQLLLTQPHPDHLYRQLVQAGYQCNCLPLLQVITAPIDQPLLYQQLNWTQLVVVASPAAAHWVIAHHPDAPPPVPAGLQWFTPGEGTAMILRHWGIDPVYPTDQHNAAAMLKLIAARHPNPRILWIGSKTSSAQNANISMELRQCISHTNRTVSYRCAQVRACADNLWVISNSQSLQSAHHLWHRCQIQPPLLVTSKSLGKVALALGYTHKVAASIAIGDLVAAI